MCCARPPPAAAAALRCGRENGERGLVADERMDAHRQAMIDEFDLDQDGEISEQVSLRSGCETGRGEEAEERHLRGPRESLGALAVPSKRACARLWQGERSAHWLRYA